MDDFYEDGYGLNKIFLVLNTNIKKEGLIHVRNSCIYDTNKILNPQVKDVKKKTQGYDDPNSKWAQDFLIEKQINIRCCII